MGRDALINLIYCWLLHTTSNFALFICGSHLTFSWYQGWVLQCWPEMRRWEGEQKLHGLEGLQGTAVDSLPLRQKWKFA